MCIGGVRKWADVEHATLLFRALDLTLGKAAKSKVKPKLIYRTHTHTHTHTHIEALAN